MPITRKQAYDRLLDVLTSFPKAGPITAIGSLPEESDEAFAKRMTSKSPFEKKAIEALRLLDSLMPLERDPSQGVWESLQIEFDGHAGYLVVENRMGARDHVTTWFLKTAFGDVVDVWSRCREESVEEQTPWDEARKERRVVNHMGQATVIDRGANFVCDLLQKAGCEPFVSCEGHPGGAYFGYRGSDEIEEALRNEFERLGWETEQSNHGGSLAYMKPVRVVAERDAEWRRLSLEFDYELLLERSGPKP